MNVTWEQVVTTLDKDTILWIAGTAIAIVTAIGVFAGPIIAQKRQEKRNNLKKHYSDFQENIITPLIKFLSEIAFGPYGVITRGLTTIPDLNVEEDGCFEAHYPALAQKIKELTGSWILKDGTIGGDIAEFNKKADALKRKLEKYIIDKIHKANINLPIKTYSGQEEINDSIIEVLRNNIYLKAEGEDITDDFNKSEIVDVGDGFYTLNMTGIIYAKSGNSETIEKCRSVFIDIQNSPDYKKEASSIISKAKQIEHEFKDLKPDLDKIQARGLISRDKRYKFKPVKQCPICTELFFTK